jgi:transcriptional regulator GlxA family with amidase domain
MATWTWSEPTSAAVVRVAVLAYDGCMSSAVAGMLDAFHIANRWVAGAGSHTPSFVARVLGATPAVEGSAGFRIPSEALDDSREVDVAIVPPMLTEPEETLAANDALVAWLRRYAEGSGVIASVCAGALFLARAGLLDGHRVTTNPTFAPALLRQTPGAHLLLERRVVDDGRVLTAGTTTAFLDLALHLIERFAGHPVAVATAKALSIDKNRRSQLPYFLPFAQKDHGDAAVEGLQTWLEDHLAEPNTSQQMARRAALSQRTLNRRFLAATGLAPIAYLHRLRVEAAKRLLETSDIGIQEITSRVGYDDARSFTRLFRQHVGLSPRGYRKRFGGSV